MAPKEITEQAQFILKSIKIFRSYMTRNVIQCCESIHEGATLGGLSIPQFTAATAIHERGEVTVKELARILGVSPPSASVMVDRLVEKGVVERRQSENDRRKVAVTIAPDVVSDFKALQEEVLKGFVEVIEKIGPETAADWCSVLTRIRSVIVEQTEKGK